MKTIRTFKESPIEELLKASLSVLQEEEGKRFLKEGYKILEEYVERLVSKCLKDKCHKK